MLRIGTPIAAQEEEAGHHRICRRRLRDNANPSELPDTLVNKAAFNHTLEELTKCLSPTKTSFGIVPIVKLCASLRFFAEGGYQNGVIGQAIVRLFSILFSIMSL